MGGALALLTQKNSPINEELAGPEPVTAEQGANEAVKEALNDKADLGFSTGLKAWDKILGFMRPGEYTVIGAKTGSGKSSFGRTIAANVARQGIGVLYCATADMTAKELMLLQACSFAAVSARRAYDRVLTPVEKGRLIGVMNLFRDLPLVIDPIHGKSVQSIREQVKRQKTAFAKKGKKFGLLVVDYIQEASFDNPPRDWGGKEEKILREASKYIKDEICIAEDIHTLGLVQTHATVTPKKGEKAVRVSVDNIQNCKAIAKPASTVGFIERQRDETGQFPARGRATIVIDKARWGGRDIPIIFDGGLGRFEDDPEALLPDDDRPAWPGTSTQVNPDDD